MALSVKHTDLGTAVTQSLRAAIVSGELAAGSRLVETDLAEQFGVSRGPIRDALAELQHTGLVELRARKGSFVASLTAADVGEIYSLRSALEALAAHQAAAAGVDRTRMTALLDDLSAANRTGEATKIGAADMALHRGIVEAAQNSRLLEAWERLADQTPALPRALPGIPPPLFLFSIHLLFISPPLTLQDEENDEKYDGMREMCCGAGRGNILTR